MGACLRDVVGMLVAVAMLANQSPLPPYRLVRSDESSPEEQH